MRTLLLALPALLAACPSADTADTRDPVPVAADDDTGEAEDTGVAEDTADTADTGEEPTLLIQAYEWIECDAVDCTWAVEADGPVGGVDFWLVETGDDAFEEGCADIPGPESGYVCGVWAEHHDAFVVTDAANAYGGETRMLTLATVSDPADQVSNVSTVYSLETGGTTLTWLFTITWPDGRPADCVTFGDDDRYFASRCTIVW